MSIVGTARNLAGKTFNTIGKIVTPKKKEKTVIPDRYHTQESAEDYKVRLTKSRNGRGTY